MQLMVKCVKFVAMQQNSATLIYDFKTMKDKVESCLLKIAQPFKTENCFEPHQVTKILNRAIVNFPK